jgi:hypothetical protein
MSDFLAAAGVTSVLKWVLSNALVSAGVNTAFPMAATISALSPDLVNTGTNEAPQLNLFMYYVSFNSSYRNEGLPSKDSAGRRLTNPPLAINLHYLGSAYGKGELDPEILLGWAMQQFHENPIISRQTIQNSLDAMKTDLSATPEMKAVANTTLADQVELIKMVPESLSNEEINKLWMAFNAHYRPTTSYQVSVVLIQETQAFKSNLPVQTRNVTALPAQGPVIDAITPGSAVPGDVLTITGRYFIGDLPADTMIAFDDGDPAPPDSVQGATLRVTIPSTLQTGIRTIRVVRNVRFGAVTDPHRGFSSSPTQFLLMPTVTDVSPIAMNVATVLTLHVTPPVGRTQRCVLFVGNTALELDARPPSDPATSSTVKFNIPASFPYTKPPTALPLRLQIDGVESKITLDTNPVSSTFGQFLPQGTVTGP